MKWSVEWKKFTATPVIWSVATSIFVLATLCWRLGGITNHLVAPTEVHTIQIASQSLKTIILDHTLNAPYYLLLHFTNLTHSVFFARLTTVLFAALTAALLYYVLLRRFGYKFACMGLLLFATSSAFLHTARLIDPSILLCLGIAALAGVCVYSQDTQASGQYITWGVVIPLLLYVPGLVWLVALVALVQIKREFRSYANAKLGFKLFWPLITLMLVAPLIYYLVQTHDFNAWLGINFSHHGVAIFKEYLTNIGVVLAHLFWQGNGDALPAFGLARLPAIDIATTILMLLGLYLAVKKVTDPVIFTLLCLLFGGWLVAALGGATVALLLPLLYLYATAGLYYLINRWFAVFPLNPIARGTGIFVGVLLVCLLVAYNTRAYFVAWPHHWQTIQTFQRKI